MIWKRASMPVFWSVPRKRKKFSVKPSAGPHSKMQCIPLGVILRDVFKYASNMKEAKEILNSRVVCVNNHIRKSYNFPVGLMDILTIGSETYVMFPGSKGLYLEKSGSQKERLVKIVNKSCLKKSKVQLNFHDGSNIIIDKNSYSTGDVALLDTSGKIKDVLPFKEGMHVILTGGKNAGRTGKIKKVETVCGFQPASVIVELDKGESISVPKGYIFVVGKDKPVIDAIIKEEKGDKNE